MMIIENKETKEIKRVYSGKEFIIALGKKFDLIHDEFRKDGYDQYYDLFNNENGTAIDKTPLFENEDEFYACLAEGNSDLYKANKINKMPKYKKIGKKYKIKNIRDLKNYNENMKNIRFNFVIYVIIKILIYFIIGFIIGNIMINLGIVK